ncbi:MAG: ABC transporter permease [Gemmatimonadetes bacterium]|nr:ABC transporter permease [Gemmatimonadota bacterium]
MLVKHPGLATIAIVALALGIGLTATMWSITWGGILRGLPFDQADRIIHLERTRPSHDIDSYGVPVSDYAAWREQQKSFEDLAAFSEGTVNLSGSEGRPERYEGGFVTAATFPLLRVTPLLGRNFTEEEVRPGGAAVIILGWDVWQNRFGADPAIIGKTIRANGVSREIVGVMPRGFLFPTNASLWLPRIVDPLALPWGQGDLLEVMGRLRDGVTMPQARREFEAIAARLAQDHPKENEGVGPILQPFTEEYVGQEPIIMLWTMMAAVFGVFLIACSNVANLLLARAATRTKEVAVRTALGASRWRIVIQHLGESLVLSLAGMVLGTGIAWLGTRLFMDAIRDTDPPFWIDIRLDGVVLLFTAGISLLAALVSGLIPALQATRANLHDVLKDEGRGTSSLRMGRFSRGLVIVELALAGGLLVAAGFMIQSVVQLARFDFGVPTANVFTARVGLFEASYPDSASRLRFWAELERRLQELPGQQGAALTAVLPGFEGWQQQFAVEGASYPTERDYPSTRQVVVSPGWFRAFGVAPVEGRLLQPGDIQGALPVAVVTQGFARTHFGTESPLGRRFRIGNGESTEPWLTVAGVVPDIPFDGTDNDDSLGTAVFTAVAQGDYHFLSLAVRTNGDPLALTPQVEAVVSGLNPDQPIYWVRTLEEGIARNTWFYGVFGTLFMIFGGAALFLATVGVYGVMSFAVSQRTREVGVRMALGASARDVTTMFLKQGGRQVLIGLSLGILLAFGLARGLSLVLFQVNTANPLMYAGVTLVLAATCLLATFVPARRAMRVDPMEALRYE